MEIIQEIGSYAGFAAVLGLAVLSALYFSQARDVKRLREWAGRAPERTTPAPAPSRVVARPIARPVPPGTPAPVPRPPGAQPAAASAAGAAPAIVRGPAPATPAAARSAADEEPDAGELDAEDVTAMDTEVHPPPEPPVDDEGLEDDEVAGADDEDLDEESDTPEGDAGDGPSDTDDVAEDPEATGEDGSFDADADADYDVAGDVTDSDTGEWHPEDEHSDIDFTDEHEIVPATPAAASAASPPQPPRPFPRRGTPEPASAYGRGERTAILPPYSESRPDSDDARASGPAGNRRPLLLAAGGLVALVILVFGVMQITGGSDSNDSGGLSATQPASNGGGGSSQAAIDPSTVTVAVLNGTTVPGLAATLGDKVSGEGFQLGTVTNNFDQEKAESVVLFAPGAEREAKDVARRLDIVQREPIDADSQALAGDASVVVVAGADQNQ